MGGRRGRNVLCLMWTNESKVGFDGDEEVLKVVEATTLVAC